MATLSSKDFAWLDLYYIYNAISGLSVSVNVDLSIIEGKLDTIITNTNNLSTINTNVTTIKTDSGTIAANSNTLVAYAGTDSLNIAQISTNTGNASTYLSTIRTPVVISTSTSGTIAVQIHNVSFYNSGSAGASITVNGTVITLPAGVTLNYNAGGNNNRYAANIFSYNGTGTTLLISYTQ